MKLKLKIIVCVSIIFLVLLILMGYTSTKVAISTLEDTQLDLEKKYKVKIGEMDLYPLSIIKLRALFENVSITEAATLKRNCLAKIEYLKIDFDALSVMTGDPFNRLGFPGVKVELTESFFKQILSRIPRPSPRSNLRKNQLHVKQIGKPAKLITIPDMLRVSNGSIKIFDDKFEVLLFTFNQLNLVLNSKKHKILKHNILEGELSVELFKSKRKAVDKFRRIWGDVKNETQVIEETTIGSLESKITLDLAEGEINLDEFTLTVNVPYYGGGRVKGNITIDLMTLELHLDVKLEGISYFTFASIFYPSLNTWSRCDMEGDLNLWFTLEGLSPRDYTGDGNIILTNGSFPDISITPMLKAYYGEKNLMDIPDQGLDFDLMTSKIEIFDTYLSFTDLKMSSREFTLDGRGQIEFVDKLKFYLDVTPRREFLKEIGCTGPSILPVILQGAVTRPELILQH